MSLKEINQIIRRYSGGEFESFEELYNEYGGFVRNVLYKLCDPLDIDDLVHDTFIKVWNGLAGFKQSSSMKTWVYRIAYNVALDDLRKRKKKRPEFDRENGTSASREQDLINRDLVQKGLQKLNEEHRTVLVLHCMEDLPLKEVAHIMDVPEGTIKSRLHHARQKMHEYLTMNGAGV